MRLMIKAKYIRRWKGKDGKWQYEYDVPAGVKDADRYKDAIQRRIKANAAQTRSKEWLAQGDNQELHDWLTGTGKFGGETKESQELQAGMFAGDFGNMLLDLRNKMFEYGTLTDKQANVVRNALARRRQWLKDRSKKQKARAKVDAKSSYVGKVGEKVAVDVKVEQVLTYDSQYGLYHINLMRDPKGNIIVYKGSKAFDKGKKIKLNAKVKEHSTREGVKQTIVSHPKLEKAMKLFIKAKYTRRWKGKDGKWHYEYGQPKTIRERREADPEVQKWSSAHDKVKRAMRSVSEYSYNLSKPQEHARMYNDKYNALKREFPDLKMTYKRFVQINLKQSNKIGLDIEDDLTDNIVKKMGG